MFEGSLGTRSELLVTNTSMAESGSFFRSAENKEGRSMAYNTPITTNNNITSPRARCIVFVWMESTLLALREITNYKQLAVSKCQTRQVESLPNRPIVLRRDLLVP